MAHIHGADLRHVPDDLRFDLSIEYSTREAVVAVHGDVDTFTAPALSGLLGALVGGGHHHLVLDLRRVDFLDASGLGIIAVISSRLRACNGELLLRSPTPWLLRLLEITGMRHLVETGPSLTIAGLGPEQRADDQPRKAAAPPARTAPDLGLVAAIRPGTEVIDAALRLVTALTQATVDGADGVSVSLTRHGRLTTVAASDETIAQMDRDQYATGEGPCLAAAAHGRWFHVESLAREARWPEFVPLARAGGIASILSTPLMVAGLPVGALNIYSSTERAFGAHDQELAALFASQASGLLAGAQGDASVAQVAVRLRKALVGREVIAQAQGMLMERDGLTPDAAYAVLRQSSRRNETTVRVGAAALLAAATRRATEGRATR